MAEQTDKKARWYVVNVQANMEKKVRELILEKAETRGLADMIEEILIPMEKIIDIRSHKKVEVERKYFPGYVIVKAKLTDNVWHLIKDTPKVTGFLGARNRPIPVSQAEIDKIVNQMEDDSTQATSIIDYSVGEEVKVIDGAFTGFSGLIQEIDEDKALLKINVSIFGRETPVTLEGNQVEKL